MSAGTRSGRPVSLGALIARINRKLEPDYCVLKITRGAAMRVDVGDMYILDWNRNFIVEPRVDPVALGREMGVLAAHEFVEGWEE